MLIEFTARDGKALFVEPSEIAGIEEKKHTIIHLKSGTKFAVQESSGEVSLEVNNFMQDKMLEMIENAGMG